MEHLRPERWATLSIFSLYSKVENNVFSKRAVYIYYTIVWIYKLSVGKETCKFTCETPHTTTTKKRISLKQTFQLLCFCIQGCYVAARQDIKLENIHKNIHDFVGSFEYSCV